MCGRPSARRGKKPAEPTQATSAPKDLPMETFYKALLVVIVVLVVVVEEEGPFYGDFLSAAAAATA